jgi:TonB family protein
VTADTPVPSSDRWIARGVSLCLHLAVLAFVATRLRPVTAPTMVVFSVDTVSGLTPRGEGSGAEGTQPQMTDKPANANPLAGGLRLDVSDAPVPPAPKPQAAKPAVPKPQAAAAPSLKELNKRYEAMDIGLKPRQSQGAEEPSEGGMGNARKAGTEGGVLGLEGAIAGRGYRMGDYSYHKPLPGESEVLVQLTVSPKGEVLSAMVKRTSGYHELDEHALSKAREISFDALPAAVPQEDVVGTVLFKFEYSGRSRP